MKNAKSVFAVMFLVTFSPALWAQTKLTLAAKESKVLWQATYILQGGHHGSMQITSGEMLVSTEGLITKGDFVLDMNSIHVLDMPPDDGAKDLEEHLKSDDFFSVARFPQAYFAIATVTPSREANHYNVDGFLSVKGISNRIQFPATIIDTDQSMRARAEVMIDRTKWNINYQSGSIFADLKDGVISDDIKITLDFIFSKSH